MSEENKAVLRREVKELYNHTGNLDVVEELFSPDYVSHKPTSGEVRGIEGARRFAATFREAFPDLENVIEDMVAEGDKVAMLFRGGTHLGETEAFGPPRAGGWRQRASPSSDSPTARLWRRGPTSTPWA